jgi:cytidine deaminase
VLCKSGKTYLGANVENASYPAGICAERSAMLGAICAGEKEFEAIAITSSGTTYAYPCGICRQFLSEFNKDIKIIVAKTETDFVETTLSALLPNMFDNSNLN